MTDAPLHQGPGALAALLDISSEYNAASIAVLSDSVIADLPSVCDVINILERAQQTTVIMVPPGEPTQHTVDDIAITLRQHNVDLVVGIGGGSVLDTAKMVAAITHSSDGIGDYALAAKPFPAALPCIAVPTTAGTGSEVTRTAIFADASGRKLWVWGDHLLPQAVILDPTLTVGLPSTLTTATGLDALVHAVEAVSGNRSNTEIEASASEAVSLIKTALPLAVKDPGNLDARQRMQQAAMLAGHAIELGGTGIAHAIGHGLATVTKFPHGMAVSTVLQAAMPMLTHRAPDRFAKIAPLFGGSSPEDLPASLIKLYKDVGFEQALATVSGTIPPIDDILRAVRTPENSPMIENTPMEISDTDLKLLCERTLEIWSSAQA